MIKVNLTRTKTFESVDYTRQDMLKIGLKARQTITERVTKGFGVSGRKMPALSPGYRKKKQAIGQPGIRNMMFSGSMLGSMDIVDSTSSSVTLGFVRQAELIKAQKNDDRCRWFGLSPTDTSVVLTFAERILQNKLKK